MTETREQLENQADRFGESYRWVRRAIDKGLVRGAEREGQGYGRGVKWHYEEGIARNLRSLHRLQELCNYRGGSLHFSAWWIWNVDLTKEGREYIVRVYGGLHDRVSRAVTRRINQLPSHDENSANHLSKEQLESSLGAWLDNITLNTENLDEYQSLIPRLLHPFEFSDGWIELGFGVIGSTLMGISPETMGFETDLGDSDPILASYDMTTPQDKALFQMLAILSSHDWLDLLIEQIHTASLDDFDFIKAKIKSNPPVVYKLRMFSNWEYERQKKWIEDGKSWRVTKAGIWRQPGAVYRAAYVGLFLVMMRLTGAKDIATVFEI